MLICKIKTISKDIVAEMGSNLKVLNQPLLYFVNIKVICVDNMVQTTPAIVRLTCNQNKFLLCYNSWNALTLLSPALLFCKGNIPSHLLNT